MRSTSPPPAPGSAGSRRDARDIERFEHLLERGENVGVRRLSFDELRELARLQRRLGALLAKTRDRVRDPEAVRYLNALCVRGHALTAVEAPPQRHAWLHRYRAAMGRSVPALVAAWALLGIGIATGAAMAVKEPRAVHALMPSGLNYSAGRLDALLHSQEAREEFLAPEATAVSTNLLFGSQLFANNTRVGILAMAAGILACIPTVLLTVYNGTVVGAFATTFWVAPHRTAFLAWILPHGIPEFTAIVFCAAAGLLLGAAMLGGDRRGRRVALREAGESALLLFGVSVPLFVLAALIESFVRESALGIVPRLAVAVAMAALVAWLLVAAGRARRPLAASGWIDRAEGGALDPEFRDPAGAPGGG